MGRMERNRWETAIRCLEIAVHPNTSDEEIVAAVNGFRRTADGTPLRSLWRDNPSPDAASTGQAPDVGHLLGRLDQLIEENRALRRRAEEAETGRGAAIERLKMAEEAVRHIGEDLFAAEHRADAAEQRLAEVQAPYAPIAGSLRHENSDLRRAVDHARRDLAQPIQQPVRPFQHLLNAAMQRPDRAEAAPRAGMTRPWTA